MSHISTKPAKWLVHPVKTKISLDIHPVWSLSQLSVSGSILVLRCPWLECTAKTLIKLGKCSGLFESSMGTRHFVGFVMQWLILDAHHSIIYVCMRKTSIKIWNSPWCPLFIHVSWRETFSLNIASVVMTVLKSLSLKIKSKSAITTGTFMIIYISCQNTNFSTL